MTECDVSGRWLACSAEEPQCTIHMLCEHRTLTVCTVCAQAPITLLACLVTDNWLVTVTPSIFKEETREIPVIWLVSRTWNFHKLWMKTMSTVSLRLSVRLLSPDQYRMLSDSTVLESTLLAGVIGIFASLLGVMDLRSAALTTYDASSIAEPRIILAVMCWNLASISSTVQMSIEVLTCRQNFQQFPATHYHQYSSTCILCDCKN